jgi:hypothetical protein
MNPFVPLERIPSILVLWEMLIHLDLLLPSRGLI